MYKEKFFHLQEDCEYVFPLLHCNKLCFIPESCKYGPTVRRGEEHWKLHFMKENRGSEALMYGSHSNFTNVQSTHFTLYLDFNITIESFRTVLYSRQSSSSELSPQLSTPLHFHAARIHFPLLQTISLLRHFLLQYIGSSDPSPQSSSLSQKYSCFKK